MKVERCELNESLLGGPKARYVMLFLYTLQGKEVMHAFVNELKEEGITYVAPWRPAPPTDPAADSGGDRSPEVTRSQPEEGAVGHDINNTSSDFGSMVLEEAPSLERTSNYFIYVL